MTAANSTPTPLMHQPVIQMKPISLTINGAAVGPIQTPDGLMMIDFLHEYVGLTGSRLGCGQGVRHACVVILDKPDGSSEEVRTCITGAHYFDGKKVRTIEGHAKRNEQGEVVELSPVQQKFLEHFSFQCGYCTPGFVNGDGADRAAETRADRQGVSGTRNNESTRRPHLPLHRLRALLRSRQGRRAQHARTC